MAEIASPAIRQNGYVIIVGPEHPAKHCRYTEGRKIIVGDGLDINAFRFLAASNQ